jgi:hypothetical protein
MDITFPRMPCDIIGLNLVDSLGNQVADYYGELHKHRLSADSKDLSTESWLEKNSGRSVVKERAIKEFED